MRKTINIIGVGERKSGIGKNSGAAYDFIPISFTYERPHFSGLCCATVNVSGDCLNGYVPSVGDAVEAVMHEDFSSRRLYVDAII